MNWGASAAALLAAAVGLGAFGAHGLKARLDPYSLDVWEKAVFYHFVHALGMLAAFALAKSGALAQREASLVCALLLAGIALFSGSLYALAVSGVRSLGAVTPVGGVAFIAAWCALAWFLVRRS